MGSGRRRAGRLRRGALLAIVAGLVGCAGGRGAEHIQPIGQNPFPNTSWEVVSVGGVTLGGAETEPALVEVSADGRTLTVFFQAGNPSCYAVTGVRVDRRDPALPDVGVSTGLRLGVTGCDTGLYLLAVRVPLDPPLMR